MTRYARPIHSENCRQRPRTRVRLPRAVPLRRLFPGWGPGLGRSEWRAGVPATLTEAELRLMEVLWQKEKRPSPR